MFQYAFSLNIAKKHQTNLKIHFINALFNTQRNYALDVFRISGTIAKNKDLKELGITQNRLLNRTLYLLDERFGIQFNKHIITQRYPYTFHISDLSVKNNSYIQGYWGDERYFKDIESSVRKEFIPLKKLDGRNQKILDKIKSETSVSIHVRRTDYITNKNNMTQFIGLRYYIDAIRKIKKDIRDPLFFVFSDDIIWCKENLSQFLDKSYFIDHNKGKDSYKDLLLMSACKHNISANSTFSWWGAWLNKNKNKICIKPNY
jgi:hypothetical protein